MLPLHLTLASSAGPKPRKRSFSGKITDNGTDTEVTQLKASWLVVSSLLDVSSGGRLSNCHVANLLPTTVHCRCPRRQCTHIRLLSQLLCSRERRSPDHRLPGESVAASPSAPGMHPAPDPRENGPLIETVASTCSSPPAPAMGPWPPRRRSPN